MFTDVISADNICDAAAERLLLKQELRQCESKCGQINAEIIIILT